MLEKNGFSAPTGETEEIFLDEEEFEALIEAEAMAKAQARAEQDDIEIDQSVNFEYEPIEIPEDTVMYDKSQVEDYIVEPEPEYVYTPKKARKKAEEEDDDFEYDDDEEVANIFSGGFTDKLIYLAGALIILFALIVGVVLITGKTRRAAIGPDMSEIGLAAGEINLIGEQGINNVLGKEAKRLSDLYEAAEEFDYSEVDEETGLVNVSLSLTSIVKDLKIKFINRNNKLVAGVPFEVEVTDSKDKKTTYTDTDKDGIIYLEDIVGGGYTVKMIPLSGFDSLYSFDSESVGIKVKDQIEYTKVDVSNEIKSESQVDKSEDSRVSETEVEAELKDTVEYVMSSKVALTDESGFTEIDKSKEVVDPKKALSKDVAKASEFKRLDVTGNEPQKTYAVKGVSASATTLNNGEKTTVEVILEGGYSSISWSSSDDAAASVSQSSNNPTKATVTAGNVTSSTNVTITVNVTFEDGSTGQGSVGMTINSFVDKTTFDLSASIGTLYPGSKFNLGSKATFTVVDKNGNTLTEGYTLQYSSNNDKVAKIDGSGVIEAVAEGTAKITVTCTADTMTCDGKKNVKKFDVTVSKSSIVVTLDFKEKTIFKGESDKEKTTLKATVTGAEKKTDVSWKSSDENVVTVSKGVLTAVNEGTATITCSSKESPAAKATCTVTVVLHPSLNTVSLLKDKDGVQLYVYDSASKKYVEAKYADYYKKDVKLYRASKVEYKYMGWWTINGKTYYFDKSGKKVTGEQIILGTRYNFGSDGALISGNGAFGIDVSTWNGLIDWNSVAKSGVSYAIIRTGFRGSTQGGLIEDSKFKTNIKNATGAGIKVGVYFFTQAVSEAEAVEEASMVLGQISGYNVTYPIFLDVESAGAGSRADSLTTAQRTAVIKAFCKTVTNSGYNAGLYANKYWLENKINTSELTAYKIWLAQYNTTVTYTQTRYDMWQYSSKGSLSGISGNVDLNLSYLGY